MNFISIYDLIITPLYLVVIYIFLLYIRKKVLKNPIEKQYFLSAITLKIIGAISLGLIYQFYYGSGDTGMYYEGASEIRRVFFNDPWEGIRVIFTPENTDYSTHHSFILHHLERDRPTLLIARIAAFFGIFSFNIYSVIAVFFALFTFWGIWRLFVILVNQYPHLHKELAISLFYMPSVFFWGSGIMKDGITLSCLCFAFTAVYDYFTTGKHLIRNLIIFIVSLYFIYYIKIYIAICFLPAIMIWIFITTNNKIRNAALRKVLTPLMLAIGMGAAFFATSYFSESDSKYNLDEIAETAQVTSSYIGRVSLAQGGSYYSLGEYDPTLQGMLTKMPQAIWVTLFRPYVWEIKNIPMFLSALESLFFLIITIRCIYKLGLLKIFKLVRYSAFLQFCFIFSFTFSFAVGISTSNFGTLVRYKIPMMPFYMNAIYILLSYANYKIKAKDIGKFIKN